jgi:hypothetical protein
VKSEWGGVGESFCIDRICPEYSILHIRITNCDILMQSLYATRIFQLSISVSTTAERGSRELCALPARAFWQRLSRLYGILISPLQVLCELSFVMEMWE